MDGASFGNAVGGMIINLIIISFLAGAGCVWLLPKACDMIPYEVKIERVEE